MDKFSMDSERNSVYEAHCIIMANKVDVLKRKTGGNNPRNRNPLAETLISSAPVGKVEFETVVVLPVAFSGAN